MQLYLGREEVEYWSYIRYILGIKLNDFGDGWNQLFLVIQSDLFGMVKWPFEGIKWDEKVTLNHLVVYHSSNFHVFPSLHESDCIWGARKIFHIYDSTCFYDGESRWCMVQLPTNGLVRGHDKPIHGKKGAIYFRGGVFFFLSFSLYIKPIDSIFSGWWFQIFCTFTPTWGRFPVWLSFFKWVGKNDQQALIFLIFPYYLSSFWYIL